MIILSPKKSNQLAEHLIIPIIRRIPASMTLPSNSSVEITLAKVFSRLSSIINEFMIPEVEQNNELRWIDCRYL